MVTIRQAILSATEELARAGVSEPRLTATALLAEILHKDRVYILTRPEELLAEEPLRRFREAVVRRARGEPLQYITGHQEFYGLDFLVTPDVLIPRPETEVIVAEVLTRNRFPRPLIIDVGTGSGCIAVALAVHLPTARILALDISQPALAVARQNAERHGVAGRIEFLPSDLFCALREREPPVRAHFIVANPPYVADQEADTLPREVREYEPAVALFAGEDPLAFHRRLIHESPSFLVPGGFLICEMGYGHYPALLPLIAPSVWRRADVVRDLQGIERTLVLERAG
jgi:release factor glutamine methyltransferase